MGIRKEIEKEDVNIYEEEQSEKTLIVTNKEIKAGTLNQLVILLTSEDSGAIGYHNFLQTFLLTYRSFTTQKKLLEKLRDRAKVPRSDDFTEDKVYLKTINFLTKFVCDNISDFNQDTLKFLKDFMSLLDPNTAQKLQRYIQNQGRRQMQAAALNTPEPIASPQIAYPNFDIFNVDVEEIARQLTLLEFENYSKISPSEMLNLAWSKPKLRYRAVNLVTLSTRFNAIALWVTKSILNIPNLSKRASRFAWFLKLIDHLRKLNNFQTLGAVYGGLNSSAVYRLDQTKAEVSKESMVILEESMKLLSPKSNFEACRKALDEAVPPCIPYISIYLGQITFTEEGNPTYIEGGLINFKKQHLLSQIILKVIKHQNEPYALTPIPQIRDFFVKLPKSPNDDEKREKEQLENQLFNLSKELEKPKK
eukprot:c16314_g1_i2.p1 GENE.c16314_g1_i2~~c16314_g1_i2.p1  ORF type:complete len:420 (-),score=124.61 c16314_g1_i2:44-1303(-)